MKKLITLILFFVLFSCSKEEITSNPNPNPISQENFNFNYSKVVDADFAYNVVGKAIYNSQTVTIDNPIDIGYKKIEITKEIGSKKLYFAYSDLQNIETKGYFVLVNDKTLRVEYTQKNKPTKVRIYEN